MKCPYCRVDNDRVTDTRAAEDGYSIRRRRQCNACSRRYTTYERAAEFDLKVVKKDGAREPFGSSRVCPLCKRLP
jgi:transcriptional repressor NrdR